MDIARSLGAQTNRGHTVLPSPHLLVKVHPKLARIERVRKQTSLLAETCCREFTLLNHLAFLLSHLPPFIACFSLLLLSVPYTHLIF